MAEPAWKNLHFSSLVADLHCDTAQLLVGGRYDIGRRHGKHHIDIPRLKAGGVGAQVFAAFARNKDYFKNALKLVRATKAMAERFPETFALALTASDVERIARAGKIAVILAVEGSHALNGKLSNLDRFYDEGVRLFTVTWNYPNPFAVTCADKNTLKKGLTPLGRKLIQKMDRLGVAIDVSHVGKKSFWDITRATGSPIIASHSTAAALHDVPRALDDGQIEAIAKSGGVIGVNFYTHFLTARKTATVRDIMAHIKRFRKVGGIDVVGLGSDFDGITDPPRGLGDASKMPLITKALVADGFSAASVKKILGGNFLRVFAEAAG